ncbi:MAG: nitrogenase-associated protein [Okeania sp. SIO3C4]|nr:nitrogenase-associated protein [Okeania sp. SIO3C4]
MAKVIFYEKPGCKNNTKQKTLLETAGHQLETHNLLKETWTKDNLRLFFGDRPVVEWFNNAAPKVKSGEVVPEETDAETALTMMLSDPLLIRRPLMQVGDRREVGFDVEVVNNWVGLQPVDETQREKSEELMGQDLQTCPNSHYH